VLNAGLFFAAHARNVPVNCTCSRRPCWLGWLLTYMSAHRVFWDCSWVRIAPLGYWCSAARRRKRKRPAHS